MASCAWAKGTMETELTVLVAAMLIASARGDLRDKKSLMNAPILIVLKGLWMRAALYPAALNRASHTPETDANREDCFFAQFVWKASDSV